MQQTSVDKAGNMVAPPPTRARKANIRLAVIAASLLLISSVMLFNAIGSYLKGIIALQYKMTDATVIKISEHFDLLGIRREAQLRFPIKGQEKIAMVAMPKDRIIKRGEHTVAFYDQNNPQNAVLTQEIDYDSMLVLGPFGFLFLCFGAFTASKVLVRN